LTNYLLRRSELSVRKGLSPAVKQLATGPTFACQVEVKRFPGGYTLGPCAALIQENSGSPVEVFGRCRKSESRRLTHAGTAMGQAGSLVGVASDLSSMLYQFFGCHQRSHWLGL